MSYNRTHIKKIKFSLFFLASFLKIVAVVKMLNYLLNIDEICADITHCLVLVDFFRNRNVHLSSVSLFTSWTKEVRKILNGKMEGNVIPTVRNPKIFGVTFDNLLYFTAHATNINAKVRRRNKVLKALTGVDKEIIVTTYKAIGRSLLNYAAPI